MNSTTRSITSLLLACANLNFISGGGGPRNNYLHWVGWGWVGCSIPFSSDFNCNFKKKILKIKIFEEGTPLPYSEPPIDPHMNYSMHSD